MKTVKINLILLLAFSVCSLPSCKNSKLSNQEKGAIIGAGGGAVAGAVIGNKSGNTAVGAIIGAAVGGTAGTLIGLYMDKQARKLEEEVKGAKVERIGEGIKMTFDSGLLFGFDSYALTAETRKNLDNVAEVLNEYEDTDILIEGHTDSKGTDSYNQDLSEKRAKAVSTYLRAKNVKSKRLESVGYGEAQLLTTDSDKQSMNRRVEVVITANSKLKRDAKRGIETSVSASR
ncbi:OmpA family protein [Persicitalea jodogahamensis]|uniref:Membrane protein n=1 Tax=Persicitalea jodogahamensis TaxID=402147 RepID=A0A8J3GB71_9BACT|nr:OmpA family protein [Persicitalea jodogahamensis]GHB88177.1 membrane protein [Persicitalea jodogahamensis]